MKEGPAHFPGDLTAACANDEEDAGDRQRSPLTPRKPSLYHPLESGESTLPKHRRILQLPQRVHAGPNTSNRFSREPHLSITNRDSEKLHIYGFLESSWKRRGRSLS